MVGGTPTGGPAIYAEAYFAGIYAVSTSTAGGAGTGVWGAASGSVGRGVYGTNSSAGYGVFGASVSGTGMYGYISGTTGWAGYFTGGSGVYVSGQIRSGIYDAVGSTSLDFNNGNVQSTSGAAGTVYLNNLQTGGAYTVIATTAISGTFTFSGTGNTTGLTFIYSPGNATSYTGGTSHSTIYTLLRGTGSYVYVSWITGL